MKRIIAIIFIILFNVSFGQSESDYTFINAITKEPIVGAILKHSKSLNYSITNNFGQVDFKELEGIESVIFHAYGYNDTLLTLNTTVPLFKINSKRNLSQVVVTGQGANLNQDNAIEKIQVINAEQITNSGANNLADILAYYPSMRLSQDLILGSGASINGISGENIKLLIDGVPVIGRQNGNIDFSQINLLNVERIEIVEGPLSVNYGSNAIGGTINIITKKTKRQGYEANARAFYQTVGNYNLSLGTSFFKKRHRFGFNVARNYFDSWSPNDPFIALPKEELADTNRFKLWNPKLQLQGEVFYDYIYKKGTISISGRSFYEEILNRGFPKQPYYETAFDDRYKTLRNDLRVLFKNRINSKINLTNSLSYNQFNRRKTTEFIDLTTLNSVISDAADAQDTSTFSLVNWRGGIAHTIGKRLNYLVGTDFIYETASGKRITDGVREIMDLGVYGNMTYKLTEKLSVKPGARYSYNSVYPSPITPSLGILWNGGKIALRGSVASGYRAPSLKELYFEFIDINHNIIGNEALRPEQSINIVSSVKYKTSLKKGIKFSAGLTGFYNEIQNQIALANRGDGVFTYFNIGEYRATGMQSELNLSSNRFQLLLNGNYTGRSNRLTNESDLIPSFNGTPDLSFQGTYYLKSKRYNVSLFAKYNGALNSFSMNSEDEVLEQRQNAFTILDFSFTAHFFENKSLSVTTGAKNLLNVTTVNSTVQSSSAHSSGSSLIAGYGTSVFISFSYNFKKLKNDTP